MATLCGDSMGSGEKVFKNSVSSPSLSTSLCFSLRAALTAEVATVTFFFAISMSPVLSNEEEESSLLTTSPGNWNRPKRRCAPCWELSTWRILYRVYLLPTQKRRKQRLDSEESVVWIWKGKKSYLRLLISSLARVVVCRRVWLSGVCVVLWIWIFQSSVSPRLTDGHRATYMEDGSPKLLLSLESTRLVQSLQRRRWYVFVEHNGAVDNASDDSLLPPLSSCVLLSSERKCFLPVLPLMLRAPHTYQKMALQYCNIILNCIYGFLICFI